MTAMLHGLVDRIADELRARLDPEVAKSCPAQAAELVDDLTRAGLLHEDELIALLLRRADSQRLSQGAGGGRSQLQRWTASDDADLAAAAMALIAARGRGRDRFGRASLDLVDLPASLAAPIVERVAAALSRRCSSPSDPEVAAAAASLLADKPPGARLRQLEQDVVAALDPEERRGGLLATLAGEGEAPILGAVLAAEAAIPAEEAWRLLLGGGERVALLLRMASIPREQAAAMLAQAVPAFGLGDPVAAIDCFDRLHAVAVETARQQLGLPKGYRQAQAALARHG